MTDTVALFIDRRQVRVPAGISVAAALRVAGTGTKDRRGTTRTSVTGMARAPLCGMGICQECRIDIDGRRVLACQTTCDEGMRISTGKRQ